MIDAQNFSHIEQVEPGVNVLFYAEHDGDDMILHQVTVPTVGTIDIKVTMPADTFEKLWPEKMRFSDAAANVLKAVAEMRFGPRVGTPLPPVASTYEERLALAQSLTWSLENIEPDEVRAIIERLDRNGYELRRKLKAADATVERFGEMFDGEEGWSLTSSPNGEYVKYDDYNSQASEISRLRNAARKVCEAEQDFRSQMPSDWEGDPLTDAVGDLRKELANDFSGASLVTSVAPAEPSGL
jgi:hypothetical protein